MARNKKEEVNTSRVVEKSLSEVLHNSMMPYSEYIILDRAIPRVEDGLKPVQRRILYAMYELGVTPDKPHRKSARIVGDCLGKYHPHGDTSVYEALVNLAQDFTTRMTLVDGHGNFGSVDGDPAAAMRYTEARLTPLSMELLRDLEKDTVHWSLNFDDTLKEPDILPSRYPNLLVNGATGIAIGMSTKIPPHNLGEVIDGIIAYIDDNNIDLNTLMEYIKGPDFPTGGYVVVGSELEEAYATGRGKVIMRAKYTVEKDGEKSKMIITELPYQVNKSQLLQKIKELKQIDKNDIFAGIGDVFDESDREGMRAVITIKRGVNVTKLVNAIISKTDLEKSFPINMIAIANGKPRQMGLKEIIVYYTEYQRTVILKRTQYDLMQAKEREHILRGLVIAIENIHKVIDIIKNAKSTTDAKQSLRDEYKLTERQAQAILDMKLARLAKLEVTKLKEEIQQLLILIKEYESILSSKKKQYSVLKTELLEIKKKYKSDRLSTIVNENFNQVKNVVIKDVNEREERKGVVVLTQDGYLKFMSSKAYQMANKSLSENDINQAVKTVLEISNEHDIIAFTNFGNALVFNVDNMPDDKWRSKGLPANKLAPDVLANEYIVDIFDNENIKNFELLFVTEQGTIKKSKGEEYNLTKRNYKAVTLKEGDNVLRVFASQQECSILFVTKRGIYLNCETLNVPVQGRVASGVRGIKLNDDDIVIGVQQVNSEGEIVVITRNGIAKRIIVGLCEVSARDRKGMIIHSLEDDDEIMFMDYVKMPYDIGIEVSNLEEKQVVNTEDIEIKSRTQTGKLPFRMEKTSKIEKVVSHKI